MNRLLSLGLLLGICILASAAAPQKPRPEIMGIVLGMSRKNARTRLQAMGTLERETSKRQEVWVLKDQRISHLLVGYDADFSVRYVTAIARTGGPRISYREVADMTTAERMHNQGNYKFTWEVAARPGQFAYLMIAHGRDPQYLESYSVKRLDQKEID
jgi:hypothetical protein